MTQVIETMDVPEHVPPELIHDFDLHRDPTLDHDLHDGYIGLHGAAPPLFYTRRNGGHWIATGHDVVREMMLSPKIFSSTGIAVPAPPPELAVPFPPLDMDDPDHRKIRALLNKFLAPSVVRRMESTIRDYARELIRDIVAQGSACEYVEQFSSRLPVGIWMAIMNMDFSRRREIINWVHVIIGHYSAGDRGKVMEELYAYQGTLADERAIHPGDDPISFLLNAEVDGKRLSRQMVLDICNLLFTAGLDTVTNALTFITRFLAENPAHQQQLRDDPAKIPQAIEEMLRRFSFVLTGRRVMEDVVLGGVQLRKGDHVLGALPSASNDPGQWPDPMKVDFDRDARGHFAFNTGPHACAGIHLARLELRVCLEEWLAAIPAFRTAPGYVAVVRKSQTMGIDNLDLVW
ncbi:cytochrome P450 [Rhizorhabdus dicambivorans]|uniref:Cytochrome P450 n=1 Tax=Rhizorhabdus dicambivorans TaxID=1850238 RepID=A0A2A4FYY8_9SPHN|nr:cytochrome P450 [Rhizorhabdus dicambivorans]ATE65815.1 cytochrome P450 [Rhizorhabdus dicambivorans]PCE42928.1 cytochrome P450 [Rhizorhabdus dicambivorans]